MRFPAFRDAGKLFPDFVEQRVQQRIFIRIMIIKGRTADVRPAGNLADGNGFKGSVGVQQIQQGVSDVPAGFYHSQVQRCMPPCFFGDITPVKYM